MRRVLPFALVAAGLVLAIGLYATWYRWKGEQAESIGLAASRRGGFRTEEWLRSREEEWLSAEFERKVRQEGDEASPPVTGLISCQAGGTTAPSFFPWPPPQGSDEQDFTEADVSAIHQRVKGPLRLNSVDLFLRDRLQRVGHSSFTYFSTPRREGYAAITRLEQIDKAGHHLEGSARFTKDAPESANLIYNFVKELVSLPEGRFRLLVFFVSADPVATQYSTEKATLKDADRWVGQGCASLPPQLAALRLTDSHKILLRIYEFVSKGSDSQLVSRAEAIPLARHLSDLDLKLDDQK
jgi:hypothetical protein